MRRRCCSAAAGSKRTSSSASRSQRKLDDLNVLVEWAEAGEPVADDLGRALDDLSAQVDAGEIKKMLGGEHDRKNAIVTIHPGAGGTESQDLDPRPEIDRRHALQRGEAGGNVMPASSSPSTAMIYLQRRRSSS